ncbi:hypothetical protein E4U17_003826 [Claviceps sp. LM77 group G4]|nr:hypothetical protein E4U17_003826 [Claviceps sp. LM77 group G4]KAG6076788.1 hypothetical protein E4U33_001660 [Claviceps sp. LM78 group G4]
MFPLFSSLPPELRHYIWRLALPNSIGLTLQVYDEERCWRCQREVRSGYPVLDGGWEIEFQTEVVDPVQLCLPQFFVNHEAHDIAAAWLRQQGGGFVLAPGQAEKLGRILRPFNAERDTLYIPYDRWYQFTNDPYAPREPGPASGVFIVKKAIRFALPEAVFWDPGMLEELPEHEQMWCDDPAKLFVIMGVQPERIGSTAEYDSWSWEMEGTEMGALVWDMTKQEFVFEQGAETLDEEHMALFARMEEAARVGLRETMIENECNTLEIRVAYAVRQRL